MIQIPYHLLFLTKRVITILFTIYRQKGSFSKVPWQQPGFSFEANSFFLLVVLWLGPGAEEQGKSPVSSLLHDCC